MITKISLFTLTLLLSLGVLAQVSPKRGMAYGYHSVNDINTVSQGVSWWYNWSDVPDAAISSYYQSIGVEFVPMVWGSTFNTTTVINNIKSDAKYLLAFNEPNFNGQSNLTPQQAVNLWPQIEQIAAAKNLQIVSACAAYCGGTACVSGYTDPTVWHDEFFSLCPTCKVDYIAFHVYEPTVGGAIALTNNMKKYGLPIWVTEFAWWDPTVTGANKVSYLQQLVNDYENDPDIYRYSWFAGRSSANSTVDILGADGALTTLGSAYINASYPVISIPGKIEAENNYRRKGTGTETTSDAGGGQNVGWTDAGTWNEYLVNATTTGSYTFNFRIASNVATGQFNILIDDVVVKSGISVPNTGGWQTWTDMSIAGVVMTSGQHLIKIQYTNTGTNLNYIDVNFDSTVPATADFSATPVSTCVGNKVVFTDLTSNKTGGETYSWNFGSGATPATATGTGPYTVTYSTAGQKTASLTVTNSVGPDTETKTNYITISSPPTSCLFSDDYNDNTVQWIAPIPGAFSHSEAGTIWTVSNGGYGEWENFNYTLNNGSASSPLDFSCAAYKPILNIKAKASANALLRVTLVDGAGKAIDNITSYNLELTTSYQTFTIDFTGKFRNYYGTSPGILDSSNIAQVQFSVNPGFASYPYTGTNGTYNSYFPGTVDIDWMGIGDNCSSSTLGVELINFKAIYTNNYSELTWTTTKEISNDYFVIEKSTDGNTFMNIGTVNGAGNSSSPINYTFEDFSSISSTTYYRLKQVDVDGKLHYSEIISLSLAETTGIYIYPNPADGNNFSISGKGHKEEGILEIRNILGEIVYNHPVTGTDVLLKGSDLPVKLNKGVYIVKKSNSSIQHKLIIN